MRAHFETIAAAEIGPALAAVGWVRVEPRGSVVMKSTFHEPARFDTAKLVVDEVTLLGSRCGDFPTAVDLLRNNHVKVHELVSGTFPLEAGLEAFQYLDRTSCLKVLLAPGA